MNVSFVKFRIDVSNIYAFGDILAAGKVVRVVDCFISGGREKFLRFSVTLI